jgi:hypothetical protein
LNCIFLTRDIFKNPKCIPEARGFEVDAMMLRLSLEYSILVFLAVTGVIQLAANHNSLHKLLFFKRKVYIYVSSAVMILPAFYVFFTWNYHYATGVIQGSEQAGLFILSMVIAIIFTLGVSSLLNRSPLESQALSKEGLDVLKEVTYFQALWRRLCRRS